MARSFLDVMEKHDKYAEMEARLEVVDEEIQRLVAKTVYPKIESHINELKRMALRAEMRAHRAEKDLDKVREALGILKKDSQ